MKRLLRWLVFVVLLLIVVPVGCHENIKIRTHRRAREIQQLLDRAGLVGLPPIKVAAFLDLQRIHHLEYVSWSPDPATKRSLEAWTSDGLGARLDPTMGVAEGCVWITFKFDETGRLKTYSVKPGVRSGFDT